MYVNKLHHHCKYKSRWFGMVFDSDLHLSSAFVCVFCLLRFFAFCIVHETLTILKMIFSTFIGIVGNLKEKEATPPYSSERSKSVSCLKSPKNAEKEFPPPIPPLPLNYQRSDGKLKEFFLPILIRKLNFKLINDIFGFKSIEFSFKKTKF